jgi:hypothetical protein
MRHATLLCFVLTACGGVETSTVLTHHDAETDDAGDSSNTDAGGCTGPPPTLECGYCGTDSPTTAICQGDGWMCPPPPGGCPGRTLDCGADSGVTCNGLAEYCELDRFNLPKCLPLPATCDSDSCECFDAGGPICTVRTTAA